MLAMKKLVLATLIQGASATVLTAESFDAEALHFTAAARRDPSGRVGVADMQHALDDGIPKGAARRAARLRLKPHAGEVRRQRGIAIANSFAIYDNAKGDCGLVKWCYNAMRLMRMPWLAGQAEVVAWTNARGAEFVRAECGPRVQRIVEFDADLEDLARRWAVATADACKTRGSRCHLGVRSVNDVALLKWQLVRHEEYQLIFLTDTDVVSPNPNPNPNPNPHPNPNLNPNPNPNPKPGCGSSAAPSSSTRRTARAGPAPTLAAPVSAPPSPSL